MTFSAGFMTFNASHANAGNILLGEWTVGGDTWKLKIKSDNGKFFIGKIIVQTTVQHGLRVPAPKSVF